MWAQEETTWKSSWKRNSELLRSTEELHPAEEVFEWKLLEAI